MKWKKLTIDSLNNIKKMGKKFLVYMEHDKELRYHMVLRQEYGEWICLGVSDGYPDISYYSDKKLVETFSHFMTIDDPDNMYAFD